MPRTHRLRVGPAAPDPSSAAQPSQPVGRFRRLGGQLGAAILDQSGTFVASSANLALNVGRAANRLRGSSAFDLIHPADARRVKAAYALMWAAGGPRRVRCRARVADGRWRWVELTAAPTLRSDGGTEAILFARFLRKVGTPAQAAALLPVGSNGPVAVVRWDAELLATSWSDGAEQLFGYPCAEVVGKDALSLLATPGDRSRARDLRHAMLSGRCGTRETAHARTRDGRIILCEWYHAPVLDPAGAVTGYASTAVDVSRADSRKGTRRTSLRDPLTGVATSALYIDRLERAVAESKRLQSEVAAFVIDLDHFGAVNESLGHRVGDALLRGVADRLRCCLREADSLARLGGDTFLAMLVHGGGSSGASAAAGRILECFSEPFQIESHRIVQTASIGIAVFPGDGANADALLRGAEIAVRRAKEFGRDGFQLYATCAPGRLRTSLERELREAIDRHELELHYQPQVDLETGMICGAEALVRWQHRRRGLLPPSEFVPLAEETGLIIQVGSWVLRTACASMRAWQEAGIAIPRMTVNVSGRELRRRLIDDVAKILCDTNLDPNALELELTETVTMRSGETQPHLLDELKSFGLRIAVDDFGVGYSSLAYLQRFPIDTLKIDRLFVRDCLTNRINGAIVRAIIAMAHGMDLEVVAEGVETLEQAAFLRSLGCDGAQGFLYSMPIPAGDFEKMLKNSGPIPLPSA